MDIRRKFGNVIRDMRTNRGWSQEMLAGRAHLHRTYVTDVERGERNLTLENISKLATGFGMPISHLFPLVVFGGQSKAGVGPIENDHSEILLAEDNSSDVELTLAAFSDAKLTNTVHVVRDGEAALDFVFCRKQYRHRISKGPPGTLLLDLDLPKVHGLDVLRKIKTDTTLCRIKVVVVTVSQSHRDLEDALRLGAASYIVKPVSFGSFSQAMSRLGFWWTLGIGSMPVTTPSAVIAHGAPQRRGGVQQNRLGDASPPG